MNNVIAPKASTEKILKTLSGLTIFCKSGTLHMGRLDKRGIQVSPKIPFIYVIAPMDDICSRSSLTSTYYKNINYTKIGWANLEPDDPQITPQRLFITSSHP